jgi:hypothetical protein
MSDGELVSGGSASGPRSTPQYNYPPATVTVRVTVPLCLNAYRRIEFDTVCAILTIFCGGVQESLTYIGLGFSQDGLRGYGRPANVVTSERHEKEVQKTP